MSTRVRFQVIGATIEELRRQAIGELSRFTGEEFVGVYDIDAEGEMIDVSSMDERHTMIARYLANVEAFL